MFEIEKRATSTFLQRPVTPLGSLLFGARRLGPRRPRDPANPKPRRPAPRRPPHPRPRLPPCRRSYPLPPVHPPPPRAPPPEGSRPPPRRGPRTARARPAAAAVRIERPKRRRPARPRPARNSDGRRARSGSTRLFLYKQCLPLLVNPCFPESNRTFNGWLFSSARHAPARDPGPPHSIRRPTALQSLPAPKLYAICMPYIQFISYCINMLTHCYLHVLTTRVHTY
jgi:hypothetical protein